MKTINVDKQVRLSLAKTFEMVISGIRFRLFRAAVTVVIISLAVAFLMTMLSESMIVRSVADAIEVKTAPRRLLGFWVSQLTGTITEEGLLTELSDLPEGGSRWNELMAWGDLSPEQMQGLASLAQRQQVYSAFFESLEEGHRRDLVARATGVDIFDALQDADAFNVFVAELPKVATAFPEGGTAGFGQFLSDWAQHSGAFQVIINAHSEAREQANQDLIKGASVAEFLADATAELPGQLATYGFVMSDADVETVRQQASIRRDAERIAALFSAPLIKQAVKREKDLEKVNDATVEMLFELAASEKGAQWLVREIDLIGRRIAEKELELGPGPIDPRKLNPEQKLFLASKWISSFDLPPERIEAVARARVDDKALEAIELKVAPVGKSTGFLGFSPRTTALILVSFMVCIVGIANAMLMSVTERFREIATMKCLGATDGFIMVNFIMESCMQGVAGGVIGAMLGAGLGIGRSWAIYGNLAMTELPGLDVVGSAGISFVLGVVISAMAAVYPASVAARLAPMEAMRIE